MIKQLNSYCTVAFLRQLFMAIYILCAAAFGRLEQLLDSYRRAVEQLQNTATHFKGLHSVSAARCNLTLAAKRLPRRCKSAVQPFRSAACFVRVVSLSGTLPCTWYFSGSSSFICLYFTAFRFPHKVVLFRITIFHIVIFLRFFFPYNIVPLTILFFKLFVLLSFFSS